jgi:MFS family permease
VANLVTGVGSGATYVALPFQVAELTGSYLHVGVIGALEFLPLIVFGLYGGVLADRVDRRLMILATEVTFALLVALLLVNSLLDDPAVWLIYVMTVLFVVVVGLQRPSLDAVLPRVVPPGDLPSAGAVQSMARSISNVAGPAVGGVIISIGGVSWVYGLDLATFIVSASLVSRMKPLAATRTSSEPSLHEIREAIGYLRSRRDIVGTYVIDMIAMILAFPYALFPFVATEFDAAWSLGFLYAAPAVGSALASMMSNWTKRVRRHGRAIVYAATVWGGAVAVAGLVRSPLWIIVCMVVAGAADMVSGLFRMLIWNLTIPDDVRGRMAGLELISYAIGPSVGDLRSTAVARATSLPASFIIGGLACSGSCVVVGPAMRELWNFESSAEAAST